MPQPAPTEKYEVLQVIKDVLARVSFLPNMEMRVFASGDGFSFQFISSGMPDAAAPYSGKKPRIELHKVVEKHRFEAVTLAEMQEKIIDRVREIMKEYWDHEFSEFFRVDGKQLNQPHEDREPHGPLSKMDFEMCQLGKPLSDFCGMG